MLEKLLSEVVAVVEATRFEELSLWNMFHCDKDVKWSSTIEYGTLITVGTWHGKPTVISAAFHRINDKLVMFYHDTSMYVNHALIEEFNGKLVNCKLKTNATNFVPSRLEDL